MIEFIKKCSSLVLSICAIILSCISLFLFTHTNEEIEVKEYTRHYVYDLECELKYWAIKSELVDSVQSYINKIAPNNNISALILVNECLNGNISIPFVLAQGFKESHFGTKGLAAKTNSVFNVGAYDGLTEGQIDSNHKFKHPNQSIKPYIDLLNKRYLVNKTEAELLKKFVDIHDRRYASYPKYEEEMTIIYNRICNTTKIKELYDKLLCYGLKLNY